MKILIRVAILLFVAVCWSHAAMRTWTSTSGQTIDGEFLKVSFDKVIVKDANGKEIKLPLDKLSPQDRSYAELANPPKLKVDPMESAKQDVVVGRTWQSNSGWTAVGNEVIVVKSRFGARIKQVSGTDYNHELVVEIVVLAKQMLDPDKFHLIARFKSDPFVLSDKNKRTHEFEGKKQYTTMHYNHASFPRGERPSETLILVWDERGEIITHNASSEWLYDHYEALMKLPVGAWMNKKCVQVYPTSPKPWYDD